MLRLLCSLFLLKIALGELLTENTVYDQFGPSYTPYTITLAAGDAGKVSSVNGVTLNFPVEHQCKTFTDDTDCYTHSWHSAAAISLRFSTGEIQGCSQRCHLEFSRAGASVVRELMASDANSDIIVPGVNALIEAAPIDSNIAIQVRRLNKDMNGEPLSGGVINIVDDEITLHVQAYDFPPLVDTPRKIYTHTLPNGDLVDLTYYEKYNPSGSISGDLLMVPPLNGAIESFSITLNYLQEVFHTVIFEPYGTGRSGSTGCHPTIPFFDPDCYNYTVAMQRQVMEGFLAHVFPSATNIVAAAVDRGTVDILVAAAHTNKIKVVGVKEGWLWSSGTANGKNLIGPEPQSFGFQYYLNLRSFNNTAKGQIEFDATEGINHEQFNLFWGYGPYLLNGMAHYDVVNKYPALAFNLYLMHKPDQSPDVVTKPGIYLAPRSIPVGGPVTPLPGSLGTLYNDDQIKLAQWNDMMEYHNILKDKHADGNLTVVLAMDDDLRETSATLRGQAIRDATIAEWGFDVEVLSSHPKSNTGAQDHHYMISRPRSFANWVISLLSRVQ